MIAIAGAAPAAEAGDRQRQEAWVHYITLYHAKLYCVVYYVIRISVSLYL